LPSAAVFYALASALFYASSVVALRPLFVNRASPETASFYTLLVGTVVTGSWLAGMVLLSASELVNIQAIAYFVLAGILGAGLARIANYHAVKILGATRGNLLVSSSPLFVLPLAALFLGEIITISKVVGAMLIFSAILILSMEGQGNLSRASISSFTKRGAALGLFAAVLYTFARLSRKVGIDYAFAPVSASFVSSATALLIVSSTAIVSSNLKVEVEKSAAKILLFAGILQAFGQVLEFVAYGTGDASLVVPLRGTTPLITVVLSYFFIRQYERMTKYLVIAVLVGVVGIVILSLGA
jgi:drug/metabolite transporter (DMT)-like permease